MDLYKKTLLKCLKKNDEKYAYNRDYLHDLTTF